MMLEICLGLKIITKALNRKMATAPSSLTHPVTVRPNKAKGRKSVFLSFDDCIAMSFSLSAT
jgi:hypothetical protein